MTPDLALLPCVAPKPRLVRGFTTEQRWFFRRRSVKKALMESDLQAFGRFVRESYIWAVPKMVGFPNKPMGFPIKNDHFGVFWGYHQFKETPIYLPGTYLSLCFACKRRSNFQSKQGSFGFQVYRMYRMIMRQIVATLAKVTPKGSLVGEASQT